MPPRVMPLSYDKKEIADLKANCKASGKAFMYRSKDDEDKSYANFLFIGIFNGKEAIFDAFIYTLEYEYYTTIFSEAQEQVIGRHPDWEKRDFGQPGEHTALMEEIAKELCKDSKYNVQEFVEVEDDEESGLMLDICLNVPKITDEVIAKFVEDFNRNTLNLDKSLYAFVPEE